MGIFRLGVLVAFVAWTGGQAVAVGSLPLERLAAAMQLAEHGKNQAKATSLVLAAEMIVSLRPHGAAVPGYVNALAQEARFLARGDPRLIERIEAIPKVHWTGVGGLWLLSEQSDLEPGLPDGELLMAAFPSLSPAVMRNPKFACERQVRRNFWRCRGMTEGGFSQLQGGLEPGAWLLIDLPLGAAVK